jgi:hypothetical protein
MTDIKLCKDCKYYRKDWISHILNRNHHYDMCASPNTTQNLDLVLKLSVTKEYMLIKKYDELDTAKECVRMCRKYENRVWHYVED